MKKVLITGGAGFIGSHIVDVLLENNCNVFVVDNLYTGSLDNLPDHDNLSFYNLDIMKDDLEFLFKENDLDYIIHLAAQTSVNTSFTNPYIDAKVNILSSLRLIELSKKYNIKKFITASSAAVYGTPSYIPINEKHPTNPISYYGLSKLTLEKYIQLSNIPFIIFRFSNVYGPRQNCSKESGVITIFHNAMLHNKQINIYGDGEQIRDFIYVKDVAKIVLTAINSNIQNEIINFSSNTGITLNELFEKMKVIYNYKLHPTYLPEREGDIKNSILSNKKCKSLFKNFNTTSFETGLQELRIWD